MKQILALLVLATCIGCFKTTKDTNLVMARWAFAATNEEQLNDIAANIEDNYGVDGFKQVFAASKLILRRDNTFDLVLFQNYRHGKWKSTDNQLILYTEPHNDSISFVINSVDYSFMEIAIDTSNFMRFGRFIMPYENISFFDTQDSLKFQLLLDKNGYADKTKDPYSRENNWWRIKPVKEESLDEVKSRVLNMVDFHLLMFNDAIEKKKSIVTYNWFTSPLVVSNNGIALRNYQKIKEDWENCFYDSAQAWYGFLILRTGFEKNLEYPDHITNPFERNKNLLEQYRKNLVSGK
jgi:hypothetical protein